MLVWNGSRESARCNTCASGSHYAATPDRDAALAGRGSLCWTTPDHARQAAAALQLRTARLLAGDDMCMLPW